MTVAGFRFVHAAVRRRKPVLVVDLAEVPGLPAALAAVCAAAGAPLHVFGAAGRGCYEPLRGGGPARNADLVLGMLDWAAVPDPARRTGAGYLHDLFAVLAAAPGDPRIPVLDDLVHLLSPDALWARLRQVPLDHPRRARLAERVRTTAGLLAADPATGAFLASELAGLRAAPLGRWLRPAAAGEDQISLAAAVRDRAVVLFSLHQRRPGRAAQMIANLAALDIAAVFAESARCGIGADGLAWFGRCERLAGRRWPACSARTARPGWPPCWVPPRRRWPGGWRRWPTCWSSRSRAWPAQLDLPGPAQPGQFVLAVKGPPGQVRAACRFVPGEVR